MEWKDVMSDLIDNENLIHGVFSNPDQKGSLVRKIIIRPFIKKGARMYQLESHQEKQVLHTNLEREAVIERITTLINEGFRQVQFFGSQADYQIRRDKSGKLGILKQKPTRQATAETHNREKKYLVPEGQAVPWMVELGIMNSDGQVHKSRYDKFRQINRYLEFIEDALKGMDCSRPLEIIDFGCGKAYLTFALYDYLTRVKALPVRVVGLDLKTDVIAYCSKLANTLGYENLHFQQGDIAGYQGPTQVDLVISLHACDTATDEALAKAVAWNAQVIMAVPCCHKELIQQINVPGLESMLKHGIIRERFGSMATDTLRVLALEAAGYHAGIMEFIDMEHTPKNLLIKAVRSEKPIPNSVEKFFSFKKTIGAEGRLENAFSKFLNQGE